MDVRNSFTSGPRFSKAGRALYASSLPSHRPESEELRWENDKMGTSRSVKHC
jgi:hypothetical protein